MNVLDGTIWRDTGSHFRGRRGKVVAVSDIAVTLDPWPGSCQCPLQQRRTTIRLDRFLAQFVEEEPPIGDIN